MKAIFIETRFCHRGKDYSNNITLEKLYKCPRCSNHIFEHTLKELKRCPFCNVNLEE